MNLAELCTKNGCTEMDFRKAGDWLYSMTDDDLFSKTLKEIHAEQYGNHLSNMQAMVVVWRERTGQND